MQRCPAAGWSQRWGVQAIDQVILPPKAAPMIAFNARFLLAEN